MAKSKSKSSCIQGIEIKNVLGVKAMKNITEVSEEREATCGGRVKKDAG